MLMWQLFPCQQLHLKLQFSGDGTEDISCKMDKTNWTVEENLTGKFSASEAEKYWESLRIHFISYLVFPGIFCQQAFFPIKILDGAVGPWRRMKVAGGY